MSATPMTDPLSLFHPLVADWFRERVGSPTDAQAAAWPAIAARRARPRHGADRERQDPGGLSLGARPA